MNNLIFYEICEAIFTYNHTVFGEVKYCIPFTLKETLSKCENTCRE